MKSKTQRRGAFALAGVLTIVGAGAVAVGAIANTGNVNNGKHVKLSQVPEAVRQTILEHVNRSDIEKIERSLEDGAVVYEIEVEGRSGDYEFIVTADGKYLGIDQANEGDHEDMERGEGHGSRAMSDNEDDADASEQVTVISIDGAPRAVRKAFEKRSNDAISTRVERIVDEGVTKYEIEYASDAGTASMTFTDRGEVIEVETPVRLKELPKAIRAEIMKDYPGATIKSAEAVQMFYYEMDVIVDGKIIEIAAYATGDIEDHLAGAEEENEHDGDRNEQDND